MFTLISLLGSLQNVLPVSALLLSVLGALMGASTKLIANWATRSQRVAISHEADKNFLPRSPGSLPQAGGKFVGRSRTKDTSDAVSTYSSAELAKKQVRLRLEEMISERKRQETLATLSRGTSRVLTFGQYIVGAMLTSSLVQTSVPKTWLGIFGLLVILCSAAKQHFHTDENAQSSDIRARRLRGLIRYTQDQVAIVEASTVRLESQTSAFIALLNIITTKFNEIDGTESDLAPPTAAVT